MTQLERMRESLAVHTPFMRANPQAPFTLERVKLTDGYDSDGRYHGPGPVYRVVFLGLHTRLFRATSAGALRKAIRRITHG